MTVQAINHVNIVAPLPLLTQVRDFYVTVIGLTDGERPNIGVPGHWLYGGGTPLVHLMEPRNTTHADNSHTGAIDHVAFTCTDLAAMEARLQRAGVNYRKREAPEDGVAQLFCSDPAGVHIELNFRLQQR